MRLTRPGFYYFTIPVMLLLMLACNRTPENQPDGNIHSNHAPGREKEVNASTPAEEEAMRQAALDGDLERVKELVKRGVNVNALDQEGHTALMFAAFNGHTEIVLELVGASAVVDRRDLMGRTALLYAATGPFPETVRALLDWGAEPNIVDSDEHFSPLMHAAAEGNLEVVRILVEHGADFTLTDVDNDDAESFARQAGHGKVADYLHGLR